MTRGARGHHSSAVVIVSLIGLAAVILCTQISSLGSGSRLKKGSVVTSQNRISNSFRPSTRFLPQMGSLRVLTPCFESDDDFQDWFKATRNPNQGRTDNEEIAQRREANMIANNGKERKDLYTDAWDGDKYKGSSFNILTVLILVGIGAPVTGVVFALATYGKLWG
eukprot:CAMPEP_0185254474 /NCGR_PEP_ID=MMETSP1359-20130426/3283_1 /TAXON_ID=552665 /ORGANISM="Bigelowiella longifila, Strain CCMP242" /LENGTH=165 /DNA_ID=CAMNT_0027837519 /DNA_START=20 /DNA_END=517 /DNA_ORIENTATION=-